MQSRLLFEGKPFHYKSHVTQTIIRFEQYFDNPRTALEEIALSKVGKNRYILSLGGVGMFHPGDIIDPTITTLRFKDGSFLTLNQTFECTDRECIIEKSVILFAKANENHIGYICHYDTVQNVANHPDHHFQFYFDRKFATPRVDIYQYEDFQQILIMLIRDKVV